jgi:hypothetical protein
MNRCKIFLFLLLISNLAARNADAQIWKKWFEKEEKRKPRPKPVQPQKKPVEIPKVKKKTQVEFPPTKIKTRYRIDVLLPLHLDELVKDNKPQFKDKLPEKYSSSLGFYQGVKLAADTLSSLGYHADVYIHDISENGSSPDSLIQAGLLAETDLIIGALQTYQLPSMAAFAKKNGVNFISVLSPSDADIKNNQFLTVFLPTLKTHVEKIKGAMLKQYPEKKITTLYRTNNSLDSQAYVFSAINEDKRFSKFVHNSWLKKEQLERIFDSTTINVVYIPIVDYNYAESIFQQLNLWFPRYKFEIFGMPSWKSINSIRKTESIPDIAVTYSNPFNYNIASSFTQSINSEYKKEFGGKPNEMVYRGYEILLWYAYLLQKYGTVFNTKVNDVNPSLFTKFEVKLQWSKTQDFLYNENEHVFLYRYQGGSFFVE